METNQIADRQEIREVLRGVMEVLRAQNQALREEVGRRLHPEASLKQGDLFGGHSGHHQINRDGNLESH